MASPYPHFRHADSDRLRVSSPPLRPHLFLTMPFDTVVLNDGTKVRLAPSFPHSVPYQKPQFPALAFGTGTKWKGTVSPETSRHPGRHVDDLPSVWP